MTRTRLSLSAYSDNPEIITRTVEHLTRTATGLALDGVETFITIGPDADEDDAST